MARPEHAWMRLPCVPAGKALLRAPAPPLTNRSYPVEIGAPDPHAAATAEGEDPGALRVLRRYERWRKSENELMSTAMDLFNRYLAFGRGPASRLAQRGLGWVDRSALLRRFFVERALGLSGDLPEAARRRA